MSDRPEREAVRMLKKLHDRVSDLEKSDKSDTPPRLLRSISDSSADADVVTLTGDTFPIISDMSADADSVTISSSVNVDGLWSNTNWSTSNWK